MGDFNPISFVTDPIAAADTIFDFSGNQARQDRALQQQEENNRYLKQLNTRDYHFKLDERDYNRYKKLPAYFAQMKSAGISPLAAIGARGASPINTGLPTGPRLSSSQIGTQKNIQGLMTASAEIDFLGKVAETIKTIEETAPPGQNVSAYTQYPTQKQVPVEVSPEARRPGLAPSYEVRKGPGDSEIPVFDGEWDELLIGHILKTMDEYYKYGESRKQWDTLRKYPDRTGRFNYLQGGDTVAP